MSQASTAHLVSIISPFHRLSPPNRAAWERAWLFHLPIIIAASPGSGPSQTGIPAATRCNWFWLMLRKGSGNKSQSRWNINKSESSSNYCIRNPARRWCSLSAVWNVILLPLWADFLHRCFGSGAARCPLGTLGGSTAFWQTRRRDIEYCLVADSSARRLPKRLKQRHVLFWQFRSPLTASLRSIWGTPERHLTARHGPAIIILHKGMKWGVIIHLSCTSAHTPTRLSAQRRLKAKTGSGRPFFPNASTL